MKTLLTRFCLTIAVLLVISGCKTTNNSLINDLRKSEKYSVYSTTAKCGIALPKSEIRTWLEAQYAAFGERLNKKGWFGCWENDAQLQQLIRHCGNEDGEECFLAFYKYKDTPDNRIYLEPYKTAVKKIKRDQEQDYKNRKEQAQKKKLASWSQKCVAFGYELRSDKHKSCMLELYKIDNQPGINTNNSDSSAIRGLLEEQKKQRELDGALELMKRGSDMMKPPAQNPTTTCQFNRITNTMVCR